MHDNFLNKDYIRHIEKNSENKKDRKNSDPETITFSLKVVNQNSIGLEGAEFSLFHEDSTHICPYKKESSDQDGWVCFGAIPFGDYIMLQTQMPAGHIENAHIYNVTAQPCRVLIDKEKGPHEIINTPEEGVGSCLIPMAGPSEPDEDVLTVLKSINPDHQLSALNGVAINVEFDSKGNPIISAKGSIDYVIQDTEVESFNLKEDTLKKAIGIHRGKAPKRAFLKSPAPAGSVLDLYNQYGWAETKVHLAVKDLYIDNIETALAVIASEKVTNNTRTEISHTASLTTSVSNTLSNAFSSTHGINASANVGVNIGFVSAGISLGYNYSWGKTNTQEKTTTFSMTSGVEKVMKPGESILVKMTSTIRKFKATVVYEAFLNGQTAYNYDSRFEDHYFWASPISSVMKSAGLKNSMTFTDEIEVSFYSDGTLEVYDLD